MIDGCFVCMIVDDMLYVYDSGAFEIAER